MTPDEERARLGRGFAPPWACAWGQDEYGVYACFRVGDVEQRMRWVAPGEFLMGSPKEEAGRFPDPEGPQHSVTLTTGCWIADTPCTQALWEVVMGSNPSDYVSPRRPVEQVSWTDVQEFIRRLNERVEALQAGLPAEAQWEYACRAGTTTATYAGDLDILGERNAPRLDNIAWYGGNSGMDYDLEHGWDSSNWKEKQYEHNRAGTREVAQKQPNPWGLFDMLGNVYEWCADGKRDYEAAVVADPVGQGSRRVIRGGSWDGRARSVRAAYRGWDDPGYRNDNLGFRLIRGQGHARASPAGNQQ